MDFERGVKGVVGDGIDALAMAKTNEALAHFFGKVVVEAAVDAGVKFQVLAKTRQGMDHPVALGFAEGHYLKGLILRRQ